MTDSTPHAADDPFGPQLPPGALYVGATLQQRIDLIEHLLEFGRQIIILSGPPGSGKSTLLTALAAAAAQRWSCVTVHGGPALQARNLYAQIADALDVDLSADSEPRMAQTMLRLRLNVLERAGKLSVLLVDDADQLPPDAVAALVALARNDDQAAEARVLMAADQDHAGLLANLQRDRPQHGLVHVVEIPALTAAQTGEFIAQRLGAVGHTLDDLFSPADLQRIAAAAAGNPARVVALARQHLAHRPVGRDTGARRSAARAGRTGGSPTWRLPKLGDRRLLPLFLLPPLLVLAAWWGLRDDGATAPGDTVAVDLPAAPAPATPAPAPTPAPEIETPLSAPAEPAPDARFADAGEHELIEITLPDEPVLPPADEASTPTPAPTVPPAAAQPPPLEAEPAAAPTPEPAPIAEAAPPPPPPAAAPSPPPAATPPPPPAVTQPAPQTRRPDTPKPPPAAPARPTPPATPRVTGFSADWLLKQPRAAYTLQLAGVRDRNSATRFIQQHGLGAEATILSTRRDGQPWYVLVHGYYPTRQAALAAAARLPAAVRKEVKPWARTVGELANLPR